MTLFLASIAALTLGPLLYRVVKGSVSALGFLDGFIFVSMGGIIFLSIIPETVSAGGWWVAGFAVVGILGPSLLERNFHKAARGTHNVSLALGLIGLGLHGVADGIWLTEEALEHGHVHHGHGHLPFAVILHRVPVGLTIWWLLRPVFGRVVPTFVLALVASSTAVGYAWGPQLTASLEGRTWAWFQALMAGSLLHVVFHRPHLKRDESHDHDHDHHDCCADEGAPAPRTAGRWPEGLGGLCGLALVGVFLGVDLVGDPGHWGNDVVAEFLSLAYQSAPALLLAYGLAGLMSAFLPRSSIGWLRRGAGLSQSLRGMALGLPLPICSCGVVPLYRTLVQQGAPSTAAMAFLVATPELGLDAILLSFPLLGAEMTLLRVGAAAILALLVGWLVGGFAMRRSHNTPVSESEQSGPPTPLLARFRAGMGASLGEGLDSTAPWILLGLAIAALVARFIEPSWFEAVPAGVEVLVFAAIGVPTYVCASGATPLVAVLILKGVSPGAALAFLLTGPATNVTTFGVLSGLHGRAIAALFSATMITLAVGLGYATNWLFTGVAGPAGDSHLHESASLLAKVCLVVLTALFVTSFVRRGPRKFFGEILETS